MKKRIFKGFALLALLGAAGAGALLATAWLERRTALTLPAPTGPWAVGRAIYDWTDEAGLDALAPAPGTRRELLAWIWYPSAAGSRAAADDYVPVPMRAEAAPGGLMGLVTRDLGKVHGHSARNPEVAPGQPYPVAIMRAGASAGVRNYSTLAEDLASHGYIVVGFDAPYRTSAVVFPDGRVMRRTPENNAELCEGLPPARQSGCVNRVLTAWTADIGFALDRLARWNAADPSGRFTGRLDMTRVGVFGHSFGGAAAAQFCHDDARCKAGIDLDGQPFGSVIQEGIRAPFLFVLSDEIRSRDPETRRIMGNIRSIYERLPADGRLMVTIRGANHFLFSDDGALLKSGVTRGILRMFGLLGIGGRRQLAVTAYCVRSFLDAYLKGAGVARLRLASAQHPEIQVLE